MNKNIQIQNLNRMQKPHEKMEQDFLIEELANIKHALDESSIVAMTDQRGAILYVNDKFCEISKYSQEELIGKDHRIINSGYHSKAFFRNLWKTIGSGRVWKGEIKNKAKDGSYYWVDTTIVPFLNEKGKPYRYLAIRTEVTEYKKIQKDLKSSLSELFDYKFALDESSIVAITDQRGKIKYVNDKFCEISGYARKELIGEDHRIINSGYHTKEFFRGLWRTIGHGLVWNGEIKNQAKDGSYYWVDTTIIPFLNERKKPYQYLSIRTEVTERKRVEQKLKTMMKQLMDVQEEEKKRLSRELHDGIGQNLYSLLISINRLNAEMDHPLINQMQTEATSIIEEVREMSWELRPSVLDDLGLIPAIRSFIGRFAEHYQIKVLFKTKLKKRLPHDVETTIYRIIQESLTNIRKYAGVDEATVEIKEIEDTIVIIIADNGKGFDMTQHANGVGLFSMKERAKSVEADLTIISKPGKGTTITLIVPNTLI